MGYVLVEVPKGVHLVATTIVYENELKTKKDLLKLVEKRIEMTKAGLLDAVKKEKK